MLIDVQGRPGEHRGGDLSYAATNQGMLRMAGNLQKMEARKDPRLESSE